MTTGQLVLCRGVTTNNEHSTMHVQNKSLNVCVHYTQKAKLTSVFSVAYFQTACLAADTDCLNGVHGKQKSIIDKMFRSVKNTAIQPSSAETPVSSITEVKQHWDWPVLGWVSLQRTCLLYDLSG